MSRHAYPGEAGKPSPRCSPSSHSELKHNPLVSRLARWFSRLSTYRLLSQLWSSLPTTSRYRCGPLASEAGVIFERTISADLTVAAPPFPSARGPITFQAKGRLLLKSPAAVAAGFAFGSTDIVYRELRMTKRPSRETVRRFESLSRVLGESTTADGVGSISTRVMRTNVAAGEEVLCRLCSSGDGTTMFTVQQ